MNKNETIVLFGATGDLARKKIIPAVFELFRKGFLVEDFKLILFIRRSWDNNDLKEYIFDILSSDQETVYGFIKHVECFEGDLNDLNSFERLKSVVNPNSTFYLSISPSSYASVITNLSKSGVADSSSKILIEKPFGQSHDDAITLGRLCLSLFGENSIYRVDHYLFKEKALKMPRLDMSEVEEIHALMIEPSLVGSRGSFYDSTGAFLDVGQNHLLMMLALTFSLGLSSEERAEFLRGIRFGDECTRAQYEGYQEEKNVSKESVTETYFKVRLMYEDKTMFIESGKGFGQSMTLIKVKYKNGQTQIIDFSESFGGLSAYANVIIQAISQKRNMFVSFDEVLEEWRITDLVLDGLRKSPLKVYPKGILFDNNPLVWLKSKQ